jgi:hypothetical protein
MSGFTRSATQAVVPSRRAIAPIRWSSPGDSALIVFTPKTMARSSSSEVLPTPVKTIADGSKPARSATSISPTEFASAPLPSSRSSRAMARVEFAFRA